MFWPEVQLLPFQNRKKMKTENIDTHIMLCLNSFGASSVGCLFIWIFLEFWAGIILDYLLFPWYVSGVIGLYVCVCVCAQAVGKLQCDIQDGATASLMPQWLIQDWEKELVVFFQSGLPRKSLCLRASVRVCAHENYTSVFPFVLVVVEMSYGASVLSVSTVAKSLTDFQHFSNTHLKVKPESSRWTSLMSLRVGSPCTIYSLVFLYLLLFSFCVHLTAKIIGDFKEKKGFGAFYNDVMLMLLLGNLQAQTSPRSPPSMATHNWSMPNQRESPKLLKVKSHKSGSCLVLLPCIDWLCGLFFFLQREVDPQLPGDLHVSWHIPPHLQWIRLKESDTHQITLENMDSRYLSCLLINL